jgi:hypothetical protein
MKYRALLASLSVALVLAAPSACTSTTNSAAGNATDGGLADSGNGGSGDTGIGDASSSEPLTCFGIFQCAADCSETDTGCEDACFARGTDEAKVATTHVVDCYKAHECADGDCLQENCSDELSACAALQTPQGEAVDTVPPASAPPDALVGKWHSYYAPDAHTEDWTFNADGTAAHHSASAYTLAGGCQWAGITDSTGTVVVTGDSLTYYQAAGTVQESNCGFKSNKSAPMNAYTYAWAIDDAGKLLLVDQNLQSCIANPGYASCRTTLDRE